jgi:hypothetical protein
MARLREKLETNPVEPNLFFTEPGMGYRLVGNASAASQFLPNYAENQ